MLIKRNDGEELSPCYDLTSGATFFTIKVYHKGSLKHQPSKLYVGGVVDFFDYVEVQNLNLTDLKKISEMCGYLNDSVIFWHKYGKFSNRWRLVSTEVETSTIEKFIPKDRVVELYFEHLDSHIEMDPVDIQGQTTISLTQEDTEYSENEISDGDMIIDKERQRKHSFEDGATLISDEVMRKIFNEEGDSDCIDGDDLKSLHSDSDNECFVLPKHNPKTDAKNPVLALGYTLESKKEFKFAVSTHEVKEGRSIQWANNDKIRIKAVCKHPDCEWAIMASVMHRGKAFQIKTYNSEHTCKNWHHRNKTINSSFIARTYLYEINKNRKWKISEFRVIISAELKAHVSLDQARRAMKKALALLDGHIKEQCAMLWDYCLEIGRSNPGTSMYMKLTHNETPNKPYRFQRIYVSFAACKEGFKAGCGWMLVEGSNVWVPIIGCSCLDANNYIFPVAHTIVEKETRETWS